MERFDMIEDALQDFGDGENESFRKADPIRVSGVGHLTL